MANLDIDWLIARGARSENFDAGQKVFLADESGGRMFVVRKGRVQIITYGTVLENVGPGGIFGEMALIDGAPRSAAALASEPTEVLSIDRAQFLALVSERPEFALAIMSRLAARIRKMNASL
ncbi:MAG: cyclic nucleotide-binding domain-containing protein [Hyphomicrobium sp.]|nr:cyclic nucleotide-binding domain-containing protein [Hyphomicrobium sp.]